MKAISHYAPIINSAGDSTRKQHWDSLCNINQRRHSPQSRFPLLNLAAAVSMVESASQNESATKTNQLALCNEISRIEIHPRNSNVKNDASISNSTGSDGLKSQCSRVTFSYKDLYGTSDDEFVPTACNSRNLSSCVSVGSLVSVDVLQEPISKALKSEISRSARRRKSSEIGTSTSPNDRSVKEFLEECSTSNIKKEKEQPLWRLFTDVESLKQLPLFRRFSHDIESSNQQKVSSIDCNRENISMHSSMKHSKNKSMKKIKRLSHSLLRELSQEIETNNVNDIDRYNPRSPSSNNSSLSSKANNSHKSYPSSSISCKLDRKNKSECQSKNDRLAGARQHQSQSESITSNSSNYELYQRFDASLGTKSCNPEPMYRRERRRSVCERKYSSEIDGMNFEFSQMSLHQSSNSPYNQIQTPFDEKLMLTPKHTKSSNISAEIKSENNMEYNLTVQTPRDKVSHNIMSSHQTSDIKNGQTSIVKQSSCDLTVLKGAIIEQSTLCSSSIKNAISTTIPSESSIQPPPQSDYNQAGKKMDQNEKNFIVDFPVNGDDLVAHMHESDVNLPNTVLNGIRRTEGTVYQLRPSLYAGVIVEDPCMHHENAKKSKSSTLQSQNINEIAQNRGQATLLNDYDCDFNVNFTSDLHSGQTQEKNAVLCKEAHNNNVETAVSSIVNATPKFTENSHIASDFNTVHASSQSDNAPKDEWPISNQTVSSESSTCMKSSNSFFQCYRPSRTRRYSRRATSLSASSVSSLDSLASPINRARFSSFARPISSKRELSESSLSSLGSIFSNKLANDEDVQGLEGQEQSAQLFLNKHHDPIQKDSHNICISARNSASIKVPIEPANPEWSQKCDHSSCSKGTTPCDEDDVKSSMERSAVSLGSCSFNSGSTDDIDPNYEYKDDFDYAMHNFSSAIEYGHFDCHKFNVIANTEEENDQILAAKAYMGLGFAKQCKGELENSLSAYERSLQLWEAVVGPDYPDLACLQYTIGTILSQLQSELEASVHFNNALRLLQLKKSNDEKTNASILCTEGMLFSVLGEVTRAIQLLKQAIFSFQKCQGTLSLNFASVMFEMGNLLSKQAEYESAVDYYNFALDIRKSLLGDSFLVAFTHYSLGVTLASQNLTVNSVMNAISHLEESLRISLISCGEANIHATNIIHAIGIFHEKRGDFEAAATWFSKELHMSILLFGEDDEAIGSISSDIGECHYNTGKYEQAISSFEKALCIMLLISEDKRSLETADILYKIASCHESLCQYDEALGIFEEVKVIRQLAFGIESGPVIKTMLRIGNVHLCQGEVKKALDCFNEILGIGYASNTVNAIEVANALYGRGCAQFCLFNLSDAMKSFRESLNWKLAALGKEDAGLACIFYQMAHVHLEQSEEEEAVRCFEEYSRLLKLDQQRNIHDNAEICYTNGIVSKLRGEYDSAVLFYEQALAMFEALFGNDSHEKIARIRFDIGRIYTTQGDNKKALQEYQSCLLIWKSNLHSQVDVANVLYEIACIFQQENMPTAERCLKESDAIWKSKLGCNDKLISVCHNSGKLWKSLCSYEMAEKKFEEALELAITHHGQRHETVASILLNLGELLQEIGQYQQALFCFDECLDIRKEILGDDNPGVASVLYSKGVALLFHGNFHSASDCLNHSLLIRREKLGKINSDVGDTLNTIGFMHLRMGNIYGDEALAPLSEALEIRRALENKSKVVSTLQNIASVFKKRKDFDSCVKIHSDIISVQQEQFGTNDVKVAEAWINLGKIQFSAGRIIEASVSYEEALRIRTLTYGYNHKSVAQVLFRLGLLHSEQQNNANAKQLLEEYIRIRSEEEDDPDEEMAQALSVMGDLQKETGEKTKAHINWISAIEIYSNLKYPETHPKIQKLRRKQKTVQGFSLFSH